MLDRKGGDKNKLEKVKEMLEESVDPDDAASCSGSEVSLNEYKAPSKPLRPTRPQIDRNDVYTKMMVQQILGGGSIGAQRIYDETLKRLAEQTEEIDFDKSLSNIESVPATLSKKSSSSSFRGNNS